MLGRLPPVGQPLVVGPAEPLPAAPAGYRLITTQSGTAALALALRLARLRKPVDAPEVLLPGYACPDLLSAAHWAGVRAVLVDLRQDDIRLCPHDLARRVGPNTVAVIAVNFLGIADELAELRAFAVTHDALLIEDDAQWLPEPLTSEQLQGDAVVLSFGRGKPVPLVGGGACLIREELLRDDEANALTQFTAPSVSRLRQRLTMGAYNVALAPLAYALLARLPLGVGATRYRPLADVRALDEFRAGLLARNIAARANASRDIEHAIAERVVAHAPAGTKDLVREAGVRAGRLLRYPLLLSDRITRDRLREEINVRCGGASAMYERVLPEIDGVPPDIDAPPLPNARAFAARLLTLPVHPAVNARHLATMAAVFAQMRG